MTKLALDPEELSNLRSSMLEVATKIREVSSGGYITEDLFVESQGDAANTLNQCLKTLVESAATMEQITTATAVFFGDIIEGFTMTDIENAAKINQNSGG
ncbi:hypothetical protein [Enterococcus wangshanyuanii]|uniref:Uncharacterized protein n=1 Tax=Enterococcus wangshanyuanii TaxID=2005703 RepID=A0ABQ1P4Q0_9ENTE|nr:hypothetical protein [Enterococcus wangshanyuanii]GGC91038.1 hypothetical protein GCM10011573_20790 [Enterococcus wangshanyuanii]